MYKKNNKKSVVFVVGAVKMCKSGASPENIRIFLWDNCVHPVEGACVRFVDGKIRFRLSTDYTQRIHRRNVDN